VAQVLNLPLVLPQNSDNRTLPLATCNYQGQFGITVHLVLTVVVLSTLPLLIFYILQRRNLIQGLRAGALSAVWRLMRRCIARSLIV
jgi:raffinose/stachyose/melibiose transport system permease protein